MTNQHFCHCYHCLITLTETEMLVMVLSSVHSIFVLFGDLGLLLLRNPPFAHTDVL